MDVRVVGSEFSNGGKLGGVTDVELGDGITQTGRVVKWLFESGMAAQLCQYCAINFAEDTVLFLLHFNAIYMVYNT